MNQIYNYNQDEKATVCVNKNCLTVYGSTARLMNGIAFVVFTIMAISVLAKVIR